MTNTFDKTFAIKTLKGEGVELNGKETVKELKEALKAIAPPEFDRGKSIAFLKDHDVTLTGNETDEELKDLMEHGPKEEKGTAERGAEIDLSKASYKELQKVGKQLGVAKTVGINEADLRKSVIEASQKAATENVAKAIRNAENLPEKSKVEADEVPQPTAEESAKEGKVDTTEESTVRSAETEPEPNPNDVGKPTPTDSPKKAFISAEDTVSLEDIKKQEASAKEFEKPDKYGLCHGGRKGHIRPQGSFLVVQLSATEFRMFNATGQPVSGVLDVSDASTHFNEKTGKTGLTMMRKAAKRHNLKDKKNRAAAEGKAAKLKEFEE